MTQSPEIDLFSPGAKANPYPMNTHLLSFDPPDHTRLRALLNISFTPRLEGQIAINTLLRRLPNLRLAVAPEDLVWRPSMLLFGVSKMPVAF